MRKLIQEQVRQQVVDKCNEYIQKKIVGKPLKVKSHSRIDINVFYRVDSLDLHFIESETPGEYRPRFRYECVVTVLPETTIMTLNPDDDSPDLFIELPITKATAFDIKLEMDSYLFNELRQDLKERVFSIGRYFSLDVFRHKVEIKLPEGAK